MTDSLWRKRQEPERSMKVEGPLHVVCQCDKCKAQEQDNAYIYASNLAKTIWQKHYIKESPKFALLDTTEGVLTQIDNMTCGLVREKPAHPEQEPVAWMSEEDDCLFFDKDKPHPMAYDFWTPLYTTPPQRTWVGLTGEETETLIHRFDGDPHTLLDEVNARLKEKNT